MSEKSASQPTVETVGKGISRVWIVPVIAVLVGGLVLWQSIMEQGPLIEIRFQQGHGIEAGKTEIRHNDVAVGLVESIGLSDDLQTVIVKARMERFMTPYLGETTQFWVVKADISGTNFSGLSTLLSGAYIETDWAEPPEERQKTFTGLDKRPLTPPGVAGSHYTLRAQTAGSLGVGSPVFYRRVKVGQIESMAMDEGFRHVTYDAFIEAPFDRLLGPSTRFWNVSGVSVTAGFDGLQVSFNSIESLLSGGVAFGDITTTVGARAIDAETEFNIFANREAAVEAQYDAAEGEGFLVMAEFDESIRGLQAGAPVEWQGIRVGRVRDVVLDLGDAGVDNQRLYAVIEMQPSRVGLEDASEEELRMRMVEWVRSGMRAQLAAGNILSGRKLIRLVDFAAEPDAAMDIDFAAQPYPRLPTTNSADLSSVTSSVEQILSKVAALPIDQLVGGLVRLVNNADALVGDPAMDDVPLALAQALTALNNAAGNVDTASKELPQLVLRVIEVIVAGERTLSGLSPESELYSELSGVLAELQEAARALGALADTLDEKPNALLLGR